MTNYKKIIIWIITLNFFIIIGAGHGIGCVGLIEILSFLNTIKGEILNNDDISFSLTSNYDKSLFAVGLCSLIGQLFLLASLLSEKLKSIIWVKIIGLIFLWIGFYYLIHNYFIDNLSQVGFFTGLPFLTCSFILAYRLFRKPSLL
jgi:hypothetical protein